MSLPTTPANGGKGKARVADAKIRYEIVQPPSTVLAAEHDDLLLVVHHGIRCSGPLCSDDDQDIRGLRYRCSECPNRDFCERCIRESIDNHDESHPLLECRREYTFAETLYGIEVCHFSVEGESIVEFLPYSYFRPSEAPALGQDLDLETMLLLDPSSPPIPKRRNIKHHPGWEKTKKYKYDDCRVDRKPGVIQIRLVRILPGKQDDRLRCCFERTEIERNKMPNIPYEFLSTSWHKTLERQKRSTPPASNGRATGPSPIQVERRAIYVVDKQSVEERFVETTSELYEALLCFRRESGEGRILWNDELCCDSGSKGERAFYGRGTGLIISCATSALIWSGQEKPNVDTQSAFGLIELLSDLCEVDGNPGALPSPQDVGNNETIGYPDLSDDTWGSGWQQLFSLFSKVVLDRGYEFHDANFAKEAFFHCGVWNVSWMHAFNVARMLNNDSWAAYVR